MPARPAQAGREITRESGGRSRSTWIWIAAIILTVAAAAYQRMLGPTSPVFGRVHLGGREVRYMLPRTHGGADDCPVSIAVPDSSDHGWILHRRYRTRDEWSQLPMTWKNGRLHGAIPHQPPGGKVAYRIFLSSSEVVSGGESPSITSQQVGVPPSGPLVVRFRGSVPAAVMIPHIALMFLGMLWSNRAGFEALRPRGDPLRLAGWSLILLAAGGLVLGPAVQWYSFGVAWTGFPYGTDLTDNKTLIAVVAWLAAVLLSLAERRRTGSGSSRVLRVAVVCAALVTLLAFAIPHSVRGTELDYSKTGGTTGTTGQTQPDSGRAPAP